MTRRLLHALGCLSGALFYMEQGDKVEAARWRNLADTEIIAALKELPSPDRVVQTIDFVPKQPEWLN